MAGRVGVIKPHSLLGQAIDVRRFVKGAAIAAHIAPAKVVNEKENDIGWPVPKHGKRLDDQQGTNEKQSFHD